MSSPVSDKRWNEARQFLAGCNFTQAVAAYEKLSKQFSTQPDLWLEYGGAAAGAGQWDLADRAWQKACDLKPGDTDFVVGIGHRYSGLRQPEKAKAWFEKAAAANPKSVNPPLALAIWMERHHRLTDAREYVNQCLAIDAKDEQAIYFAAVLDRRENKLGAAETRLRDLIASDPRHQFVQYACRYELAEVLDRTERYDEAMQLLTEAKSLVRRLGNIPAMLGQYDSEASQIRQRTQALPRDILRAWAKEFPERGRETLPKMAFLGGHPRSGTTLLEQILASHPAIAAVDEARAFPDLICRLFLATPQINGPFLNVLRRRYLEAIQRESGEKFEGRLLLDKNPTPSVELRIWLRIFPESRILFALRDPRDVIVSCYFQNVPLNPYNANFLSLERTAKRYADLVEVWLAVRQWEGLCAMETKYEDTVANVKKEGARVTEFLGLPWDPAQERFFESTNQTPQSRAYFEASQPVFTRSVARWRAYEKHLAPVLSALEPYCRALGYT
jgi:tetratricopeptide (TPR) repeat protein